MLSTNARRLGLNLVGKRPEKLSASGAREGVETGARASGQQCSQGLGDSGPGHLNPKANDNSKQQ